MKKSAGQRARLGKAISVNLKITQLFIKKMYTLPVTTDFQFSAAITFRTILLQVLFCEKWSDPDSPIEWSSCGRLRRLRFCESAGTDNSRDSDIRAFSRSFEELRRSCRFFFSRTVSTKRFDEFPSTKWLPCDKEWAREKQESKWSYVNDYELAKGVDDISRAMNASSYKKMGKREQRRWRWTASECEVWRCKNGCAC